VIWRMDLRAITKTKSLILSSAPQKETVSMEVSTVELQDPHKRINLG
jgi:hypothetical protein